MCAKWLSWSGLAFLVLAAMGCNDGKRTWMREEADRLNEMAAAMATITDLPSYQAVKPKLRSLYDKQREQRHKVFGGLAKEDKKAVWEGLRASSDYPMYEVAARNYLNERERLRENIPDVYGRLAAELILPSHRGDED